MRATDYNKAYPEDLIGQDFFKDDMLEKLGVTSYDLEYKFGSYKLPDVQECDFEGIDWNKPYNFGFDSFSRPVGGVGLATKESITKSDKPGRGLRGKSPFTGTGFDAGHILGRELFLGSDFNTSKKNMENIYRQTTWSNEGNQPKEQNCYEARWGYNQTYFENLIRNRICKKDSSIEVKYRADLIYHEEELIPRGIHIRSLCNKPDEYEELNFNYFIPNVEIGGIIGYNFTEKLRLVSDE
ncbi:hypothetical protein [Streptococcus cristatus]|uniref:hypothetical protein n=1 Tax=Streptococcus cristatus TaxID=45634 RepID=UPI0028D6B5C6|nr:hypothetical protein [Streptococcus cristatus]